MRRGRPRRPGRAARQSRVGSVDVAAGPGAHPLRLQGTAYLTEGYRGAPYGLSLVVPAIAGPYDLGTVVVRSAISVGADDARITVETDPLPQILGGIPLRLRSIGLTLDRAGFMLNPTSCGDATIGVDDDRAPAAPGRGRRRAASAWTAASALKFAPAIKATATPSTKTAGAGPARRADPGRRPGQPEVGAVRAAQADGRQVEGAWASCACRRSWRRDACPAASQVGGARGDDADPRRPPLKGAVYLVQNNGTLPSLVAVLRGGGLTIQLEGATSALQGRPR